jgi:hypothetical protein
MLKDGVQDLEVAARARRSEWFAGAGGPELGPAEIAAGQEYGGGPGRQSAAEVLERLRTAVRSRQAAVHGRRRRWRTARQSLDIAVQSILDVAVLDRRTRAQRARP